MLSRAAISVPQPVQADRGFEIERRSGTRAATTLTKLPNARAGGKTSRASATFTGSLSAALASRLSGGVRRWVGLQVCFRFADTSIEGTWHEFRARRPTSHIYQSRRS